MATRYKGGWVTPRAGGEVTLTKPLAVMSYGRGMLGAMGTEILPARAVIELIAASSHGEHLFCTCHKCWRGGDNTEAVFVMAYTDIEDLLDKGAATYTGTGLEPPTPATAAGETSS